MGQGGSFVLHNQFGRVMDGGKAGRGWKVHGIVRKPNQKYEGINWVFEEVPSRNKITVYRLRNAQNNSCIDDVGGKRLNFWVHFWDCNNHNRNQWLTIRESKEAPLKPEEEKKPEEKKPEEKSPKKKNLKQKNQIILMEKKLM